MANGEQQNANEVRRRVSETQKLLRILLYNKLRPEISDELAQLLEALGDFENRVDSIPEDLVFGEFFRLENEIIGALAVGEDHDYGGEEAGVPNHPSPPLPQWPESKKRPL